MMLLSNNYHSPPNKNESNDYYAIMDVLEGKIK